MGNRLHTPASPFALAETGLVPSPNRHSRLEDARSASLDDYALEHSQADTSARSSRRSAPSMMLRPQSIEAEWLAYTVAALEQQGAARRSVGARASLAGVETDLEEQWLAATLDAMAAIAPADEQ